MGLAKTLEMAGTITVSVVDRLQDHYQWYKGGFGRYSIPIRSIRLSSAGRNIPVLKPQHEDGETYYVHNWERADGVIDKYSDVLLEAENNGLNEGLKAEREEYRTWLLQNGHHV